MKSEADRKRQVIVNRAARLFDRNGYHSTSMDDIAAAVGLRKPSLYHYFESKEEILVSIHEEFIDLLISRQADRAEMGLEPSEIITEVMSDILELMDTHRGHVRVFFEHHRELPAKYRKSITAKRDSYQEGVETAIIDGIDRGEFRTLDSRLATLGLFGMCNWAYQWYRKEGLRSSNEIAHFFADLFLSGVRAT